MSILQRVTRSVNFNLTSRTFSTSRIALADLNTQATPVKATGLYQFFENNQALPKQIWTGRAWKAEELRQKSFDDLHKLWYVLLKERNVLATQREEASRLRLPKQLWTNQGRLKKCQKSMARIKCVLNERQRKYEQQLMKKVEETQ
ncbi:mitochondrial 39-S ribosomal protein L47 (MRP-L47)-domain-containing protein [Pilaira anomala]|nr:mitochondrial 39-S ribosomal protein L47 (MRP-L47)-domain-containing protein [Pilaira anomala]